MTRSTVKSNLALDYRLPQRLPQPIEIFKFECCFFIILLSFFFVDSMSLNPARAQYQLHASSKKVFVFKTLKSCYIPRVQVALK